MQFQTNPYLIWQLLPVFVTLWLGIYVQSRPQKKPESDVLTLLMFAGAFWSLADAIQLLSPSESWQTFWHLVASLTIPVVPAVWFALAVKFSGYFREQMKRFQGLLYIEPVLAVLAMLTNGFHHLFFTSRRMVEFSGMQVLYVDSGPLLWINTWYSYLLIGLGVLLLGVSLIRNFKNYGIQAYGLILGVLTPLLGNMLYQAGIFPPGFPDPTPISFTVTGISFAWAIFSGRMLDVVPIAHEAVIANLSSGLVVLDLENRIMDINPAARAILGLDLSNLVERPLDEVLGHDTALLESLQSGLDQPPDQPQEVTINPQWGASTYEVQISGIQDKHGHYSGRILQFSDVSRRKFVERRLANSQETMASILESLQDFYFETDLEGRIVYINKAFCEHLGYERKEDLVGKHFRHFADRRSVREVFLNFKRIFDTGQPMEMFRYTYRTRDGREHIGETTITPIMEGGVAVGARSVLRNITEKVAAEENLRRTKEEAENRVRELSSINRIATVSSQTLDLEVILQTLCEELTRIFPVRNAGIGLITPDRQSLEVVSFYSSDPNEESALGMLLPIGEKSATWDVIHKKKTVVIQDSQKDERTRPMADVSKKRGTKSIMIVPLMTRGTAIGTIGMPARDPDYQFNENEIRMAETIAIQIAAAIDNAQLYEKTESALDKAEGDLEIGRQIQSGFFPDVIPDIPGWEIASHFEASRQVAGDFYDFFPIENSRYTALVIADVCDKGVGAALFMVLFRSLLRAFSRVDINNGDVRDHLRKIITSTNNYISEIHGNSNMFATMFLGILDPDSGILYYVNGGHEPPVMLDRNGSIIRRLKPTGPAVGIFPGMEYVVEQVEFNLGDFLVGYTDGTTDARNPEGEVYSEERLLKYIQAPWTSLFSMVYELKNELHNYAGPTQQFDDITLISIRRLQQAGLIQHAICRDADIACLGELCDFVEASTLQSGFEHEEAFAFRFAAEEICKNVITYGFEGRKPGYISIFFERDHEFARMIIRDNGMYFHPDQAPTPDLEAGWEERSIGGLGIHLVRQLMDEINYVEMKEGGNQLTLEKKINHLELKESDQWNLTPHK